MDEKSLVEPEQESIAKKRWRQFWRFLYNYFGPHVEGTRLWLYLTMLFLLVILLVAAFTPIPFVLLLTLKALVVLSFALCLTMGITGIFNEYYRREAKNREYFFPLYLYDLCKEYLVLSDKRIANIIKFTIGFLLFAAVVALLVCTSGAGIVIPVVTAAVNVATTVLASVGMFAGSSWFAAIFLGVLIMVTYDAICRIIELMVESCGGGNEELLVEEASTPSSAASYADAGRRFIINESSQRRVINDSKEEAGIGSGVYNWFTNLLRFREKPLTSQELKDGNDFIIDPATYKQPNI